MDVAGRMALQKADGSLVALAAIVPNSEQSSSPSWIQTGLRKDCMRTHLVRVSSHVDILLRSIPCFASKRNKEVKDRARPFLFLSPKNKKTAIQQHNNGIQACKGHGGLASTTYDHSWCCESKGSGLYAACVTPILRAATSNLGIHFLFLKKK